MHGPRTADGDEAPARRSRRRPRRRLVRRLADLLLIAGGLVLAFPLWSAGYAQVQQHRLNTAYRQQSVSFDRAAAAEPKIRRQVPPHALVRRLALLYKSQLKAGDPVGRIKIPAIGVDCLVQQGVSGHGLDPAGDVALLRAGPVHYGSTPLPGAGQPFAVAGHRTTYSAPFNKLDKLRPGDAIYVDTPYAHFRYGVAKTTVVLPTDVGVLLPRGYDLVLTTCTPLYSASHRLIVWAKLDYERPVPAATAAP